MSHQSPVIRLSAVCKQYRIYARPIDRLKQALWGHRRRYFTPFDAVKSLDLEVYKGETVGIIGRNGSGKSTSLQMICGTLTPSSGQVQVQGRISALLELGSGFSPEFSGRENVFLNAAILGLTREETASRYDEIVAFSGLNAQQLEQPVHTYSSGMVVRLAFSVAVAVQPDVLIVDEALAVGDEAFTRRCYARIKELQQAGATILFVSHSAQSVIDLCDRAVLLDAGEKLCEGNAKDVVNAYQRFIYSSKQARETIREELKAGKLLELSQTDALAANPYRTEYAPDGGCIEHFELTDMADKPVNMLHCGKRYRLHYRVRAQQTLKQPRFGMMLKTARGVEVGGAIMESIERLEAGEVRRFCFEFDCSLRPEHYFLNCGFTRQQGDEAAFVHRIIDALDFKVLALESDNAITPTGLVDLNITISHNQEKADETLRH